MVKYLVLLVFLATKSALTAVENKISDVSTLVKKTKFNTKVTEIERKIPEVTSLITKTNFDAKFKKISGRVTSNKFQNLLVEDELKNLKTFDLGYFKGKNYFEGNDGTQNALAFQTVQKHSNLSNVDQISKWKSKALSNQYLSLNGAMGDVVLRKPKNPMNLIFKGKSILYQHDNDVMAGGNQ